jgi:hypothetical protein
VLSACDSVFRFQARVSCIVVYDTDIENFPNYNAGIACSTRVLQVILRCVIIYIIIHTARTRKAGGKNTGKWL